MALSGDFILMDHRSELGPIDPQVAMPLENGGYRFVPAQTILDGFSKAKEIIEIRGAKSIPAYIPLISKYDLHLLEICQNAKDLAQKLAEEWLVNYMFSKDSNKESIAKNVAAYLAEHKNFYSHARPIKIKKACELGLKVIDLRENHNLQRRIWELYCCIEHLFHNSPAVKVFENSKGVHWSRNSEQRQVVLPIQGPIPPGPPQGPPHKPNKK